jgi:integrase
VDLGGYICPQLSPMKTKKPEWPRVVTVGNASVKVYRMAHAGAATGYVHCIAWSAPEGRQRRKIADESEALQEARLIAAKLNAGEIEAAGITRTDRDELLAARRLAGNTPLLAALEEWARARAITDGDLLRAAESWRDRHRAKIEKITVAEAITRYTQAKTKLGRKTAVTSRSHLDSLGKALGEHYLTDVTEGMLTAHLSPIEHPVSRNTHRKKIVTLWRWCRQKKLLPQDARTEAELVERAQESPNKIGVITPATLANLLALVREKHPADLAALVIAAFAGLRRSEVHGQAWDDIDLEDGHITVTQAKEGTPSRRLVKLAPAAVEWLMLAPSKEGMVCDGLSIDRIRKAGIEAGLELPENCFRHSYISAAVADTGNVPQVALDSGNSPKIIHAHYRALMKKRDGEAWFATHPGTSSNVVQFAKEARA